MRQGEKVGCGCVTPSSVPATLAVKPLRHAAGRRGGQQEQGWVAQQGKAQLGAGCDAPTLLACTDRPHGIWPVLLADRHAAAGRAHLM